MAAFLLNFLPYVGAIAGVALSAAVAIVHYDHLTQALLVPALYLTATAIEGQLVTPIVLGRRLELNTVSVFVTVIFWGWLWGIPGALVAVPFLVCMKVVCDNVDLSMRWAISWALASPCPISSRKRRSEGTGRADRRCLGRPAAEDPS